MFQRSNFIVCFRVYALHTGAQSKLVVEMRMEGNVNLVTLSRSFRHGFRTLSYINWPLASGFGALVSIVGAILAVRDGKLGLPTGLPWSFGRANDLEKSFFVPGLRNLGNNCFLNVVLQVCSLKKISSVYLLYFF